MRLLAYFAPVAGITGSTFGNTARFSHFIEVTLKQRRWKTIDSAELA